MSNAFSVETGDFASWASHVFTHPAVGRARGKRMLGEALGLTAMEVSVNSFPVGAEMPFAHRHRENEELYLFLSGEGELRVDEQRLPVRAGTAVRVSPEGVRTWKNTGATPLVYVVIQARAGGARPVRGIEDGEAAQLPG